MSSDVASDVNIISGINSKYKCTHKIYGMLLRCPDYNYDDHYHCANCGEFMVNMGMSARVLKTITIYDTRATCERLTDHL